ncbi:MULTISPECIES: O-acetylhomoserine aminocarboxypropyltransferase/cysteine synthase family protein [Helicobacter]|uniref:O-acetylhomoserine aminocarboxypropyltransferase/cysteine synthase family protein n=2 Tax=Helicobacteraceae TaxID=72293 RepID=UPI00202AB315|nr:MULTISPECIES: aminotransferase class I/II-fold pyridoxal phosphate-dependent enzyme [Helicobacter]MCL9822025.1 aminotransferase class I/II-fold pyridoxal phosphate-dependent enzyme [Helicobacter colisuis]MDY5615923.1 aminotransferase class I/II-fold pyridoxal phosphate-dependent enzyme [Helicobacter sp.]
MPNLTHNNFSQETLALHAGYTYDSQRTLSVPIYQNTAYSFESLQQAAARFGLQELGNIYSRLTNPTTDILGARLAAIEGGAFGVPTSSGSAAIFYALVNLAQNGDNIAFSNKIYGGTQTLLVHTLKRFGIEARVFDIDDIDNTLEKVIDSKTKAIFFESLSNPQIAIADAEKITKIAKAHGIVSICDNTVATAFLHKPFDYGVDIAVYSLSKYVNGQGSALGGAVIERNGLNELIKDNPRYLPFNTPDESYHGLVYASLPLPIFSIRLITEWLRNIGATLSPQNAWIILQGLETLELRIQKHSANALEVAKFLESHPKVKSVNYPALSNNPYHHLVNKYFTNNQCSGLISFESESFEEAQKICNALELFAIVANIGDSKSLIIHPASTTHSQLSQKELDLAGITPATIRLSIGLESPLDLIADLKQALEK